MRVNFCKFNVKIDSDILQQHIRPELTLSKHSRDIEVIRYLKDAGEGPGPPDQLDLVLARWDSAGKRAIYSTK